MIMEFLSEILFIMNNNKNVKFFNIDEKEEESEDDNFQQALKKKQFEGSKGMMLLELQKSYKGDKRFNMDKKFFDDVEVNMVSSELKSQTDLFDGNYIGKKLKKKAIIREGNELS